MESREGKKLKERDKEVKTKTNRYIKDLMSIYRNKENEMT